MRKLKVRHSSFERSKPLEFKIYLLEFIVNCRSSLKDGMYSFTFISREMNASSLKLVTISIEINMKGINQAIQTMKNLIQSETFHILAFPLDDYVEHFKYLARWIEFLLNKVFRIQFKCLF
jgi:hypothetical protein